MNQLPPELLSYVFVLGVHLDCENDEEEDESVHISPCMQFDRAFRDRILSVCTRWHQVALSTPQLWSDICITINDSARARDFGNGENGGVVFESVARDLTRSRACPLDILIDARDPDWNFSEFE